MSPELRAGILDARTILNRATNLFHPSAVWACLSGGHDSIDAAELSSEHPKFSGCLHINTGIGVERTRLHVRDLCRSRNWRLEERTPPNRQYEDLVREFGFPGPPAHRLMYSWLKERALRKFVTEEKLFRSDRILLVTGVRQQESQRRMGTTEEISREGCRVWVAPMIRWSHEMREEFLEVRGLPRNPVVDILGFSGECLCGAFAKPGEIEKVARACPETAARIERLEGDAKALGFDWCWDERPPKGLKNPKFARSAENEMNQLCSGCIYAENEL